MVNAKCLTKSGRKADIFCKVGAHLVFAEGDLTVFRYHTGKRQRRQKHTKRPLNQCLILNYLYCMFNYTFDVTHDNQPNGWLSRPDTRVEGQDGSTI